MNRLERYRARMKKFASCNFSKELNNRVINYVGNEVIKIKRLKNIKEQTKAALELSLAKWENNNLVKHTHTDEYDFKLPGGVNSCALCELFYEEGCRECPLYKDMNFCINDFSAYHKTMHSNKRPLVRVLTRLLREYSK